MPNWIEDHTRQTAMLATRFETSDIAFQSSIKGVKKEILEMIRATPMTCDEVIEASGKPHQSVSAHMNWLMRNGYIKPNGNKRKTRMKRFAIVWESQYPPVPINSVVPTRQELLGKTDEVLKTLTELQERVKTLTYERDEARREICEKVAAYSPSVTAKQWARERGWECFKEIK